MQRLFKRLSTWTAIIGTALALLAFVPGLLSLWRDQPLDPEKLLELICGAVILWISCILTVIFQHAECIQEVDGWREQSKQDMIGIFPIYKNFYNDPWFREKLREFSRIIASIEDNIYARQVFERIVDDHLTKLPTDIRKPFSLPFPRAQEEQRVKELTRAV